MITAKRYFLKVLCALSLQDISIKRFIKKSITCYVLLSVLTIAFLSVNAEDMKLIVKSLNIKNSAPKTVNGVTYIPLRPVLESLGWQVQWSNKQHRVTCTTDSGSIYFTMGSRELMIDGQYAIMDNPLVNIGGRSYVSRKYVTQQFGKKIRWNKKDNLIILSDSGSGSVSVNGGSNIIIAGDGILVNIFEPCSKETLNDMMEYSDSLLKVNNPVDALSKYKDILENISPEEMPELYARLMNNMGNAYSMIAETLDPCSNIPNAIDSYKKAVVYYRENDDSANYSIILNNLANAYRVLADITDEKSLLDNAANQYSEILKFYTLSRYPLDYALIQYNRGKVYEKQGLVKSAEECLKEAKDVYEKVPKPLDSSVYAVMQYNLGNIYSALSGITYNEEYIQKSEKCFFEALNIWTAESFPMNYAKVNKSLGDVYINFFKNTNMDENFYKAIDRYEESLKFYSVERQPLNYALTYWALGDAYVLESGSKNEKKFLENANAAYEKSLEVFNLSEYPNYYKLVRSALKNIN